MRLKQHLKTVSLAGPLMLVLTISTASAEKTSKSPAPESADQPTVETTKMAVELPPKDKKYREQTPPAERKKARKLFDSANEKFEQRRHDDALKEYLEAYELWKHPRILFNIAVCLGYLGRPLESAEKFKEVLRYGPDPITPERYKQASERYTELMGQLAQLVVTCNNEGAEVFVNGKPIGKAPLTKKVNLGPGTHMVSATQKGKIPFSEQVRLEPGTRAKIEIVLKDFSDVMRYKTVDRYHWAVPAAVSVAAGVFLAAGIGLVVVGRQHIDDIQRDIDQQIEEQGRGTTFTYDTALETRAINQQIGGQVLMGLAGAAAVTATVLWLVRKKRVSFTETGAEGKKKGPTVKPKGAGVEVRF